MKQKGQDKKLIDSILECNGEKQLQKIILVYVWQQCVGLPETDNYQGDCQQYHKATANDDQPI